MVRRSQVIKGGWWCWSGACPDFITMANLDQAARREQGGTVGFLFFFSLNVNLWPCLADFTARCLASTVRLLSLENGQGHGRGGGGAGGGRRGKALGGAVCRDKHPPPSPSPAH